MIRHLAGATIGAVILPAVQLIFNIHQTSRDTNPPTPPPWER